MLMQVRSDVEQGSALGKSFSKYPKYFDRFYCNLVSAGESGGVLESLLDKLAVYKEKTQAIKKKVKTALTYPIAIIVVANCAYLHHDDVWYCLPLKKFMPIWVQSCQGLPNLS